MAIEIKELTTKKELKAFIRFQWKLYQGVPQFVPPIMEFELSTFDQEKNPAFEVSEGRFWMAYKDNKPVGRIAGIIHGQEAAEKGYIRFGWVDFIDDHEVSSTLIQTVVDWGKSKGLKAIHGPLGFTDLDFEGTLVSGFDEIATQATNYNFPYYQEHFDRLGFKKDVDWIEARIKVPLGDHAMLKDLERKARLVSARYKLQIKSFKSGKEILKYADQVFKLLNEAYSDLYGYYPLNEKQIQYYIDAYFGFVRKDFILMVVDEDDQLVGFAITFPSLSIAFQNAKGHLYPFGFLHVLKAFYFNDTLDFFLIAAKEEYQGKGVNALLWQRLLSECNRHNIKYIFSGQMMEENTNVNNLLDKFASFTKREIRRRCYIKKID